MKWLLFWISFYEQYQLYSAPLINLFPRIYVTIMQAFPREIVALFESFTRVIWLVVVDSPR